MAWLRGKGKQPPRDRHGRGHYYNRQDSEPGAVSPTSKWEILFDSSATDRLELEYSRGRFLVSTAVANSLDLFDSLLPAEPLRLAATVLLRRPLIARVFLR